MVNINDCCQNCGKSDCQLRICKHCKVVFYCSDICEMEDKIEHSRVCSVKNISSANADFDEENIEFKKETQIAIPETDNDGDDNNRNSDDDDVDDDDGFYYSDSDSDDDEGIDYVGLEELFNPLRFIDPLNPLNFFTNPFLMFNSPLICPCCNDLKFQHFYCPLCRRVSYCSLWCLLKHSLIHKLNCRGRERHRCALCKKLSVTLIKCSTCNQVEYCSTFCRNLHWKVHRTSCAFSETRDDESFGTSSVKGRCARCKKSDVVLKKCSGCNNVQYCSKICQKIDWKRHKPSCKASETKDDKSSNGKSVQGQCARCKKSDGVLKECSGCNIVKYCSRVCQSADWTDHKALCKKSVKSQCARCKKSDAVLKKCSGCDSVEYCSKICQTTDWEHHKTSCKRSIKGQCARCKKSGVALKKCVVCNSVEYCSRVCQTADWEHHKTSCKTAKTEDGESSNKISVKGQCGKCKRSDVKLTKYTGCNNIEYCSQVCQIADQRDHRKSCQISESKAGECANCSRSMRKCSNCHSVEYCSKECENAHWKYHKTSCRASKTKTEDHFPSEKSVQSQCARCKRTDVVLKKCSACNKIEYCSKTCQTADWKHHKNSCKTTKPKDDKSSIKKSVEAEKCDNCGKSDEHLMKCVNCKNAKYCSKSCQKSAWPLHKKSCKSSNSTKDSSQKDFDQFIKTMRYAPWLFPRFKIVSKFIDIMADERDVLLVAFIIAAADIFTKPNYLIVDIDGFVKCLLFNLNNLDPQPYFTWDQLKPDLCFCILNPKICPEYKIISVDFAEQIRIL